MPGSTLTRLFTLAASVALGIACAKQTPPPETAETQDPQPIAETESTPTAEVTPTEPPAPVAAPTGPLACDSTHGADLEPRDGCITASLSCGQTLRGHTQGGGGSRFDTSFYQSKFCFVSSETYDGEERVYRFSMPASTLATVELTSPCEDLDLFVMQWSPDECPTRGSSVSTCDVSTRDGGGSVKLDSIRNPRNFLLVVEGKAGVQAPFDLSVSCADRD